MAPKRSTRWKMPPMASSSSSEEVTNSEEEEQVPETNSEEEEVLENQGREDEEENDDEQEEGEVLENQGTEDEEEDDDEEEGEVPKKPGGEDEEEEKEEEEDFVVVQKSEKITQKPLPSLSSKLTLIKSQEENKSETESETESGTESDSELEMPKAKRFRKKKGTLVVREKSSNDVKKMPFQRVWSEDDEVAVLAGMINYVEKNGVNAIKCMASFHEFVKGYLSIDISLSQLKDKIFRLKRKFENNRKGKMGEEKIFNKAHDQTIFDLSKRIWGSEVAVAAFDDSSFKFNGKVKTRQESNAGGTSSNLKVESPYFDMSDAYVVRNGSKLMHGRKKDEMDEKLRQLHVEELKLFLKRNDLVREYTNVVLAAYQNKMD